jgi:hypothetical protein
MRTEYDVGRTMAANISAGLPIQVSARLKLGK